MEIKSLYCYDTVGSVVIYNSLEKGYLTERSKEIESNRKNTELERFMVKVNVWRTFENYWSTCVGHVSLDFCSNNPDSYFSFWPTNENKKYKKQTQSAMFSTFEMDVEAEGNRQPIIFHFFTLDKQKMIKVAKLIREQVQKGSVMYNVTAFLSPDNQRRHNCCTAVWRILTAGGINKWNISNQSNFFRPLEHVHNGTPSKMNRSLSKAILNENNLLKCHVQNQAKWISYKLHSNGNLFVHGSSLNVNEMVIDNSSVDISILPKSIQTLTLFGTEIVCNGRIELPNLKYLRLYDMSSSCLSHFKSVQLTHIHFNKMCEMNLNLVPESVRQMKISSPLNNKSVFSDPSVFLVDREMDLDKLILEGFPFDQVEEIVNILKPEHLVVYNSLLLPKELMMLLKTKTNQFAIGRIRWEKEYLFPNFVDKRSNYYFFKGGNGHAIQEEDFLKCKELFQ